MQSLFLDKKSNNEDSVSAVIAPTAQVQSSGDGVVINKRVETTTYNGNYYNEAGNPFIKITFELDATEANNKVLNYSECTKSTDIVLMLDTSNSMKGDKFKKEKAAAMSFVEKLMEQGDNVRLCVITFDSNVKVLGTFGDSKAKLLDAITCLSDNDLGGLTDLQGAIIAGQRQIRSSSAGNKAMVLLTDGEPNLYYSGANSDEMASTEAYDGVTKQIEYAKSICPEAVWYTIGYDLDNEKANNLLKYIASENDKAEKFYYSASVGETGGIDNLQMVFNKISNNLQKEIESNKLVDILPPELMFIDAVNSNESSVVIQNDAEDNSITFSWGDNDILPKLYRFSFIVEVDMSSLPAECTNGTKPILTNGSTIDINNNVSGSSYFAYAGEYSIKLYSPAIYVYEQEVIEDTATPEPTPTPNPSDVITVSKTAQWVNYNGSQYDYDGNRYAQIQFRVDMRYVSLDNDSYMTITDTIPKECTLLDGTLSVPNGASTVYADNKHLLKFVFPREAIDNMVYIVKFTIQVNKAMLPEEVISGNIATVYTNGPSVYQPDGTSGSSVYQYGEDYLLNLDSPQLKFDTRDRYSIIFHPNGGTFVRGSAYAEYVVGEGLLLPGPADVVNANGFEIVGWSTNPQLKGGVVRSIPPDATGNMEFWAIWQTGPGATNPSVKIEKSAEWTSTYDEEGNPRTKYTFDIDMTDDGLFYYSASSTGENLELMFAIDASQSMKDSGKFDKVKENLKETVSLLYEICGEDIHIGIVACSSTLLQTISTKNVNGEEAMLAQIDALEASGDTDIAKNIIEAKNIFAQTTYKIQHKYFVVVSDGYNDEELIANPDPYTAIAEQYSLLKKAQPSIKTVSAPYDADDKTLIALEDIACNNDRGAWLYLKCTDDEELLKVEEDEENTGNISTIVSAFDNTREYYSVVDMFSQFIHIIVEKIGAGIKLIDYVPSEYTVLPETIFCNSSSIVYEFNETNNTLSFRVKSEGLRPALFKVSFEAVLDLSKMPESCIDENGIATVYTNGLTVSEYKANAASIRYGTAMFSTIPSPKLEINMNGAYNVTLHSEGGTIAPSADVTGYRTGIGIALPSGAQISRKNYRFLGWYDNPECIGTRYYVINGTEVGDKEYWAKWERTAYPVYLRTNGGIIEEGKNVYSYYEGEGALLPTELEITRENYSFAGWYTNSWFGGNPVTEITDTDTGTKYYYAKWSPDVYNVTLHTNGGTISDGNNLTKYVYGRTTYLPKITDITYDDPDALVVFSGWFDNPEFMGTEVVDISPEETGDKEYWAKWVDISSLKDCANVYVYGLEMVDNSYKAQKIVLSIGTAGVTDNPEIIKVWVGATENPLAGQMSDIFELETGKEEEVVLPQEIVDFVGMNKADSKVYLHIMYGSVRLCTEVKVRYCAAFEMR